VTLNSQQHIRNPLSPFILAFSNLDFSGWLPIWSEGLVRTTVWTTQSSLVEVRRGLEFSFQRMTERDTVESYDADFFLLSSSKLWFVTWLLCGDRSVICQGFSPAVFLVIRKFTCSASAGQAPLLRVRNVLVSVSPFHQFRTPTAQRHDSNPLGLCAGFASILGSETELACLGMAEECSLPSGKLTLA
jgi:hypothetical protein